MSIRVFGLTGGVASGKSTVAARFRERGLDVIDADQIARDVVAVGTALGTEVLREIVDAFGPGVLLPGGELDRKRLGARVFANADERQRLGRILHPRIASATAERAAALERAGIGLACYEAALLVENGLADAFRPLVVVSLGPERQRRRLIERDGLTPAEADQRILSQLPLVSKVAMADYVIDNDGTAEQLVARADEVLDQIRERFR